MLEPFLIPIDKIEIPTNSRSRLYPTLIGLQEIFKRKPDIVDLVLKDLLADYSHTTNDLIDPILDELIVPRPSLEDHVSASDYGVPGMTAWQTLVAIALRQAINYSHDDLEVEFNHNDLLRELLRI
ncbi:MAG: hypothetical protein HQL32_15125 [Planctomycetes bacterium]|nr:hypothetical protein [Planctomycetota bacterium]